MIGAKGGDHLDDHCMDLNLPLCMLSDMYIPSTFCLFGYMVLKLVKVQKMNESPSDSSRAKQS